MKHSLVALAVACLSQALPALADGSPLPQGQARTLQPLQQVDPTARIPNPTKWPTSVEPVVGQAIVLEFPGPVSRVVMADPTVADYRLISSTELYVLGKSVGSTNLLLWGQQGGHMSLPVTVGLDLVPLRDALRSALPKETQIEVQVASGSVVLKGGVTSAAAADAAVSLAQAYVRNFNEQSAGRSPAGGGATSGAAAQGVNINTQSAAASPAAAGTGAVGARASQVINLLEVRDDQRLAGLSASLRQALPQETGIQLGLASGSVVLSGAVSTARAAEAAVSVTEAYARATGRPQAAQAGSGVINLMRVRDAQQVMLDVRIAEVSKSLLDQLGLRVQAAGGGDIRWSVLSNLLNGSSSGLGLLFGNGNTLNLDAEKKDGLVKILAQPTIAALSGQEGSFLAGGKVFIPVPQSGNNGPTLQEREFGVGLKFVPTVLQDGQISLKVAPEVSELSKESITIGSGIGATTLPAFTTRRVSTTVQLRDGESLVIGGLMRNNLTESVKALPLLGEMPVLGALFRSSQFATDLTELVVVVRATLVKPQETPPPLPTDKFVPPTRSEFFLERRLEGRPLGEGGAK